MKQADDILSILTFSEQRKGILFFLQEKPRTLTDIKEHFDVKSPNILPRLREMEAKNLIIREDGMYWLTSFGKVAAFYYKPFLDTLMAIEANEDFWNKHDISIIPKRLWYKIKNLKGCNVIKGEDFVFESHKNFIDCIAKSQHFRGATCIFFPEWIKLFSELSSQEREIEIIITKEIFEKIKREYATELKNGLKNPNAHLYICDLKIAFAVTDIFSTLSLFFKN
jgi:predicted transcriptional regulator